MPASTPPRRRRGSAIMSAVTAVVFAVPLGFTAPQSVVGPGAAVVADRKGGQYLG